jgi:hypothetical protein
MSAEYQKSKQMEYDLKVILGTENGRRYLYELIDFCGLYRPSMTGNSQTFFNEGMRNVGMKIMADVTKADANSFIQMMTEHKNRKETERRQASDNNNEPKEGN